MFWVNRNKRIAKFARGKVLDVGVGGGNAFLNNVVGIDIKKSKKPKNYKKVFVMDAQNMKFKSGSFDSITVGCVLAHLENPSAFLRECHRVLNSSGLLIITVPNPFSPFTLFTNLFFPTRLPTAKEHISVIPPRNLTLLFSHNGFKIEKRISLGLQIPKVNKRFPVPVFIGQEIVYICKKSKISNDGILRLKTRRY